MACLFNLEGYAVLSAGEIAASFDTNLEPGPLAAVEAADTHVSEETSNVPGEDESSAIAANIPPKKENPDRDLPLLLPETKTWTAANVGNISLTSYPKPGDQMNVISFKEITVLEKKGPISVPKNVLIPDESKTVKGTVIESEVAQKDGGISIKMKLDQNGDGIADVETTLVSDGLGGWQIQAVTPIAN